MQNIKKITLEGIELVYQWDEKLGILDFSMIPESKSAETVPPRDKLSGPEVDFIDFDLGSPSEGSNLVQVNIKELGESIAFSQGRTMRNSPASEGFSDWSQEIKESEGETLIITTQNHPGGFQCIHTVRSVKGVQAFEIWSSVKNVSEKKLNLQMLSSFCLGDLSPFHPDDATESLHLHRYRSTWSTEGRHEKMLFEELQLERSWGGYGAFSERYGQVGTMPVRGHFPFIAVEDSKSNVFWGARLSWAGSWQMEAYRKSDKASISGGLADRELGHWMKVLAVGESITSPVATVSTSIGSIDELCDQLLQMQEIYVKSNPNDEKLPIIFNEWCSSWGKPTEKDILKTAKSLSKTPTGVFVIDDGWAERIGDDFQQNGDWNINKDAFPNGFKGLCDELKKKNIIPGIWFEFEVCNSGSQAHLKTEWHLKRDQEVIDVKTRRFWDLSKPEVQDHLASKVIDLLKESGFQYLKVDYNDTIGIGCDHDESLGEGLRQQVFGIYKFFKRIHEEIPDIMIENCSSGGHRLEPSMQSLCTMGSFSDAHETREIPIIGANLSKHILPRQNQIWAVIRSTDTVQRIGYSMAATLMGRMCVSGKLEELSEEQFAKVAEAQEFYLDLVDLIKEGYSRTYSERTPSYRNPKGWQAYVRSNHNDEKCYVVFHAFENLDGITEYRIPVGNKKLISSYNADASDFRLEDNSIVIKKQSDYTGMAFLLGWKL